jgi:YHS domain-containing protein/thiol-disulfide isomerase/thioredoxin
LAAPSAAQEIGVHWQQDLEAAKATARQTGRLVLVHVWSDGCVPCRALEQNVFNQPSFAAALEAQYVPVKLNANEYPAIAQGFGITRVPTDVILTPDGQVLSKSISPATPSAYISEVTQVANQYLSQSGHAFQNAVATAPMPSTLNAAYANLQIGQPAAQAAPMATAPFSTGPSLPAANVAQKAPVTNDRYGVTGPSAAIGPAANVPNAYAAATPSMAPPIQLTNPYPPAYTAAAAPSMPTTPVAPFSAPAQRPAITPVDTSVPPAYSGGIPTSAEASQSRPAMQPNYAVNGAASVSAPIGATANASNLGSSAPDVRQLPAGSPPLAFDGYCPVSMRAMWKWVPGDARYGAIHRGRTYWFAGPKEQQQFLANPDFYSPALSGLDPVMAIDHRQSVPGIREHSLDYDNQFYMFSSEATLQQFSANPERYANGARQAMGMQPTTPVVR